MKKCKVLFCLLLVVIFTTPIAQTKYLMNSGIIAFNVVHSEMKYYTYDHAHAVGNGVAYKGGAKQEFVASADGYYAIELGGGDGGAEYGRSGLGIAGGLGGVVRGYIWLNQGETLEIFVAGAGGNGEAKKGGAGAGTGAVANNFGMPKGGLQGGYGGGRDGDSEVGGGGGGGGSLVRKSGGALLAVAGGGGGSAPSNKLNLPGAAGGNAGGADSALTPASVGTLTVTGGKVLAGKDGVSNTSINTEQEYGTGGKGGTVENGNPKGGAGGTGRDGNASGADGTPIAVAGNGAISGGAGGRARSTAGAEDASERHTSAGGGGGYSGGGGGGSHTVQTPWPFWSWYGGSGGGGGSSFISDLFAGDVPGSWGDYLKEFVEFNTQVKEAYKATGYGANGYCAVMYMGTEQQVADAMNSPAVNPSPFNASARLPGFQLIDPQSVLDDAPEAIKEAIQKAVDNSNENAVLPTPDESTTTIPSTTAEPSTTVPSTTTEPSTTEPPVITEPSTTMPPTTREPSTTEPTTQPVTAQPPTTQVPTTAPQEEMTTVPQTEAPITELLPSEEVSDPDLPMTQPNTVEESAGDAVVLQE